MPHCLILFGILLTCLTCSIFRPPVSSLLPLPPFSPVDLRSRKKGGMRKGVYLSLTSPSHPPRIPFPNPLPPSQLSTFSPSSSPPPASPRVQAEGHSTPQLIMESLDWTAPITKTRSALKRRQRSGYITNTNTHVHTTQDLIKKNIVGHLRFK